VEGLKDDPAHMGIPGRVLVLGDFNAHHLMWGSQTTPRGTCAADWATATDRTFTQHIDYQVITWCRVEAESLLDLAFNNNLTTWEPDYLNLSRIGSDHSLTEGTMTAQVPDSHTYTTSNLTWWEEYIKNDPGFTPTLHNEAYSHLLRLLKGLHSTKTASAHSKT